MHARLRGVIKGTPALRRRVLRLDWRVGVPIEPREIPEERTWSSSNPVLTHSPVVVKTFEKRASDFAAAVGRSHHDVRGLDGLRLDPRSGSSASGSRRASLAPTTIPFQFLTFIVSLEAIFLSTFVMIGQNRAAAFQQAKADHDFREKRPSSRRTRDLTRAIHELTLQLHQHVLGSAPPETA